MRHNGERRPEEIQAEIERTRGDMHATLSAIEQRLTPGQLVDQGLDYLKNSGAREFTSNLGNSVKNNPMPVALMGIAVAWMMIQGNRKPAYAYSPSEYGYGESGTAAYGSTGSAVMTQRAGESLSSAKDRMSQSARSAKETLSSTARSAKERMHSATQRVGEMGQGAREQMSRMREGYDSMVREQPLALGAVGLAIGALLAAMTPRTRQEDELMGEASDRLTEKAKEVGKEQLGKAQQVATAAKDAAMGEAEKQGIPAQALAGGASSQAGKAQSTPQSSPWSGASSPQSGSSTSPQSGAQVKPTGRPNVIEPARATPMSESTLAKNPGSGKPGGGRP